MRILALDLSKRSTGWACFSETDERPIFGHWQLGSEYTSLGKTFLNLHQNVYDLHKLGEISHLFYEDSLLQLSNGGSNPETLRVLGGLCMHVESIGEALGVRVIRAVHQATWRKHFIGRGTSRSKYKKFDLKAMSRERCEQFGFKTKNDDEADAIGVLDYACDYQGIIPPWRRDEVFRPELVSG